MSEIKDLGKKIDDSNTKMDRLIETMTTFIAFQARAEERHDSSSKRLEKLETLVDKLWLKVHTNSIKVNGAQWVACLIIGAAVGWAFKQF